MANKTKATPQREEARQQGPETSYATLPLLDLSDAAVTKMIQQAVKRGYATYEELNAVVPSEEITSEQIEDILAVLNEMGINVVETEEAEVDEGEARVAIHVWLRRIKRTPLLAFPPWRSRGGARCAGALAGLEAERKGACAARVR